jgi:hypothetical protein
MFAVAETSVSRGSSHRLPSHTIIDELGHHSFGLGSARTGLRDRLSSPLPLENLIEVVEHRGAALNTLNTVGGEGAYAVNQRFDAGNLGTAEFVVLEIDIVDDLGDCTQRGILKTGTLKEHLESALITFVGEFRLSSCVSSFIGKAWTAFLTAAAPMSCRRRQILTRR